MPLKTGKAKSVIAANIEKLIKEGKKPSQAAAIAYAKAEEKSEKKSNKKRK